MAERDRLVRGRAAGVRGDGARDSSWNLVHCGIGKYC